MSRNSTVQFVGESLTIVARAFNVIDVWADRLMIIIFSLTEYSV